MAVQIDTKFEGKLTCAFKNDMRNLVNFHQSTWKSQNWDFDRILFFVQSWKCMSLKFIGELCVMAVKNDAKIEEDSTCQFKIDIRNLRNFDPSTRKSQKVFIVWPKYKMFELKKYRGVMFCGTFAFKNCMKNLANSRSQAEKWRFCFRK